MRIYSEGGKEGGAFLLKCSRNGKEFVLLYIYIFSRFSLSILDNESQRKKRQTIKLGICIIKWLNICDGAIESYVIFLQNASSLSYLVYRSF